MSQTHTVESWAFMPLTWLVLLAAGVALVGLLVLVALVVKRKPNFNGAWVILLFALPVLAMPLAIRLGGGFIGGVQISSEAGSNHPSQLTPPLEALESFHEVTLEASALRDNTSTAPIESLKYPNNRPAWVQQPQRFAAGVVTWTVSSDPFASPMEALAFMNQELATTVGRYASLQANDTAAGEQLAPHLGEIQSLLNIETRPFQQHEISAEKGLLLGNVYVEQVVFPQPVGAMYQAHARVVIDEPFEQFLANHWRSHVAQKRVGQVGVTVVIIVLGLLLLSALLRVGPPGSKQHVGRLQSGSAAAILMLIASGLVH